MKVKDEYNFKNNSKKFFFNNVGKIQNILWLVELYQQILI